jgi:hypothetical protein
VGAVGQTQRQPDSPHPNPSPEGEGLQLAQVFHGELWGNRSAKNEALWSSGFANASPILLPHQAPQYPFVARDYGVQAVYKEGFSVAELMPANTVGIVTARDALTIDMDKEALWARVEDFAVTDPEILRDCYALGKDVQDWGVRFAKADVIANFGNEHLVPIAYRPFDTRWTYYTGTSRGFHCRPRREVMKHFIGNENVAMQVSRQRKSPGEYSNLLVHNLISESSLVSNKTSEIGNSFPLYLYPEEGTLETERRINFDPKIYAEIRARAGLAPTSVIASAAKQSSVVRTDSGLPRRFAPRNDKNGDELFPELPDELRVFDYIYGVLHSPDYRRTYAQFLKIDFPRIPYPASPEVFAHIAEKGGQLRRLHLMEDGAIGAAPYPFKGARADGDDNVVVKPSFVTESSPSLSRGGGARAASDGGAPPPPPTAAVPLPEPSSGRIGRVHINPDQYFEGVPATAWEFHIGGYQPAQKWLKDRKGRALSFDDVVHYQKIIKILCETDRIMREIILPL